MPIESKIVFDIGCFDIRVGLVAEGVNIVCPKLTIPAVVGYPRLKRNTAASLLSADANKDRYVGTEVQRFRSVCDVVRPISSSGSIERFPDLQLLIEQAYELLNVVSSEVPCVVTVQMDCSRIQYEEIAKYFLRDLRVPSFMMIGQGACCLFSMGETSGIAVDLGEGSSRSVAVLEGVVLPGTWMTTPHGGLTLSAAVKAALIDTGQTFALEHTTAVKEAMCFVLPQAPSPNTALEVEPSTYRLPDGQVLTLQSERYRCAEILFGNNWESHGNDFRHERCSNSLSVTECIASTATNIAEECRDFLFRRTFLCGGTAMLNGIQRRLERELIGCREVPVDVRRSFMFVESGNGVAPSDRTWAGAAIFACLKGSDKLYVTQECIAEEGLPAVSRHRFMCL